MPIGGPAFSSVRRAREVMKERAEELINLYISGMKKALDAGDYETFQKGMSDITKHIPGEEGERVFDIDVDKIQIETKGNSGPMIQIGVSIGGTVPTKALPETTVIDVKALPESDPASNS
jgi:hypothetical protein